MADDPDLMGAMVTEAIEAFGRSEPRTQQSWSGIIGPSDLGFCRMKAALMTKGVPQSDSRPILAAQMGTGFHEYAGKALRSYFPDWIVDNRRITATFPSGAVVTGTPDIVTPNGVFDIKTCDGVADYVRNGPSLSHRYQRHTYGLAAIQEGILPADQPVFVGNIYFDRRGKDAPHVNWEWFDEGLTSEIDSWITDVIYAVKHDVEASRDVPAAVCERICEHFTVCRGGLPMTESVPILDDELVLSAEMYVEGRELKAKGTEMMRVARNNLFGVNGATLDYQVRWVDEVDPETGEVKTRIDVRRLRRRA